MDWFAVRTAIDSENRAQMLIQDAIQKTGLQDKFGRMVIPTEEVSEIRRGKTYVTTRKVFAGYLFIEMENCEQTRLLVLETQGVSGFVGVDSRTPVPMEQHEIDRLLSTAESADGRPKPKVSFEIDETVKVKEGAFEGFEGVVENIDPDRGTMRISVMIFGRKTPVELEYWQVEKL